MLIALLISACAANVVLHRRPDAETGPLGPLVRCEVGDKPCQEDATYDSTVFNPSNWDRTDLVTATVAFDEPTARAVEVVAPDGRVIPSVLEQETRSADGLLTAGGAGGAAERAEHPLALDEHDLPHQGRAPAARTAEAAGAQRAQAGPDQRDLAGRGEREAPPAGERRREQPEGLRDQGGGHGPAFGHLQANPAMCTC